MMLLLLLLFQYFEGVCGGATTVILAPSAGCEGFAQHFRHQFRTPKAPSSRITYYDVHVLSKIRLFGRQDLFTYGIFLRAENPKKTSAVRGTFLFFLRHLQQIKMYMFEN